MRAAVRMRRIVPVPMRCPSRTKFSLHAAMPPTRILLGESDHQFAQFIIDHGSPWPVGVGPFPGDQATVPREQRAGRYHAVPAQVAGQ